MNTINQIQLPNGSTYDFEDTAAREEAANKADKTLATSSADGLMSAADKKAIDREFFRMVPKGGTYIPANADLNSIEYIKVGNYYNTFDRESKTIKNIPVIQSPYKAFMMYVLSPLLEVYDNESTDQWVYRLRIFITYTGDDIFVQKVDSGTTPGRFNYGPWVKMTNSNDLGAVSKIINDHAANKSNPHGVTKAQVGLGSVANLDQSKAIKSITRNGTTFTATALDGTTTTFTQQDNNTTYGIATSSTDGLMSKTDKTKLDSLSDSGIQYVQFKLVDDYTCSTTDSFDTIMSMILSNKPVQASVNTDGKIISLPVFMYDAGSEEIMFRNDEMYIILASTSEMIGDSTLAIYGPTITDKLQDNDTTETSGQAALDAHMGKVLSDRINAVKAGAADQASQFAKNTAQIETAGTATNAHSAGEYVMISNALYKVTASVAKGDTWTIGTNVTAANVGSEISSLKSDLAKHSTIICLTGSIFNEKTGPGIATGTATVVLNGGMALIFFDVQTTTLPSGTDGAFTFGINIDHLRSMNPSIPAINPQNGGVINYIRSDGTVQEYLRGYGGCFQAHNNDPASADFLPGRVYKTDGDIGGWDGKSLQDISRMSGVAIGTY